MKKILVTGAGGTVGYLVTHELDHLYDITGLDKDTVDVADYVSFSSMVEGQDMIVHLAWDTKTENYNTHTQNPDNLKMTMNVYRAAVEHKIKRVIMASSVHADDFYHWDSDELMDPYRLPNPDSPYGVSKVFMEAAGRYYASQYNLEVICLRLGGVIWNDKPMQDDPFDQKVWLSRRDCADLIQKCVDAKQVPTSYCLMYAVSDNTHRVHDISNPFGWIPQDGT